VQENIKLSLRFFRSCYRLFESSTW